MQVSKINSTNFYGAKNSQAVKKAIKPVVEEMNAAERAAKSSGYFYYGNPVETVKNVKPANVADLYVKETEQIVTEKPTVMQYGFVTDSMIS